MADILLRRLATILHGKGEVKAFADDTAVILNRVETLDAPAREFQVRAGFSNLHLNLGKTVLVPLFLPGKLEEAKAWLRERVTSSLGMRIEDKSTYLGIEFGTWGGKRRAGTPPHTRNCRGRDHLWTDKGLGILYALRAYRTVCVSILQFDLQLDGCNDDQREVECSALLGICKGPGNWIPPQDIWVLRAQLGYPWRSRPLPSSRLLPKSGGS